MCELLRPCHNKEWLDGVCQCPPFRNDCRFPLATRLQHTKLCALKLNNAIASCSQAGADLIDLRDGVGVLEATERLAVLFCLVVDFGLVAVLAVLFDALQHEGDFGGGEGLFVGHAAEFEARSGFLIACWWGTAARCLRGDVWC